MAKVDLNSPTVVEQTPRAKVLTAGEILETWYKELDAVVFQSFATYDVGGLQVVYNDVVKLRAILSRLDSMLSKAQRMLRKLQNARSAANSMYEDEVDKLRCSPGSLIAKGFAQSEREATYRSNPVLIPIRIKLRELDRDVSDVETFVKVVTAKYRNLEGARSDQLLQTSLIRMSLGLWESPSGPR